MSESLKFDPQIDSPLASTGLQSCLMSKTATIRARIEPTLKGEVDQILSNLSLTASETIHLLCRQIKLQRGSAL